MEKHRQKTALAACSDHLLRWLLAAGLGVGWFVFLWGLSLPALAAGLALGGLIWLLARMLGKKRMDRREASLRRRIGGELALDRLLLLPPRHAAFQAALWLAPKAPVEMQRTVEWGVVGSLQGRRALIRLIAQHPSMEVTVQQVIDVVKEMRAHQTEKCFLCLTASPSREAAAYAEETGPDLRVVRREELISLAGACSPATDEDLRSLRARGKKRRSLREWLAVILHPGRAKRYFWYGAGLSALALLTGQGFYPLPAILCLLLFAGCKAYERWGTQPQW